MFLASVAASARRAPDERTSALRSDARQISIQQRDTPPRPVEGHSTQTQHIAAKDRLIARQCEATLQHWQCCGKLLRKTSDGDADVILRRFLRGHSLGRI